MALFIYFSFFLYHPTIYIMNKLNSENKMEYKYNYFYKITNNVNGHFYYGIHSTNNINDGYMGSGIALKRAFKKYGIENFSKEIIKYFDTRKEAAKYEEENVTMSLINEEDCYNIVPGGEKYPCVGMTTMYDNNEKVFALVASEKYQLDKKRYSPIGKGMVCATEKITGKRKMVSTEEYYKNKEQYTHHTSGKVLAKDKNGKIFLVEKNDERLENGELNYTQTGVRHTKEWSDKVKEIFKEIGHQQGSKNSQYGKLWVYKGTKAISIKKEEEQKYLDAGWKRGRKEKQVKEKKIPAYKTIDEERAFSLHEQGYSWRIVAEQLGVTVHVMERFLRWKKGVI